jgi:hypothetical protein
MFVLPNRKAFADSIVRIFKKYRTDVDPLSDDADVDMCADRTGPGRELFTYQKIVRDYLLAETPYRGLLLYHGLGSGKTCSSIAVAESLLSKKKIYVFASKSLLENFKGQLRECGDPFYKLENHWTAVSIKEAKDREKAKSFGISDAYLDKHGSYYVTHPDQPSNFKTLPLDAQKQIASQINDIIDSRFVFIPYDGITSNNIDRYFPPEDPGMFNDTVIIIDEAHNLIGAVLNESALKTRLYDLLYHAKNAKIVALSGTPVVNKPQEIAYMMNLLKGPIERVIIPTEQVISWDEGMLTTFFKSMKDVDTIEYNSVKRYIMLTRNPPFFESVYNDKGERIAVKYNKDFPQDNNIIKWVDTWRAKFQEKFGEVQLVAEEKIVKEELECLPTKFEDFMSTFIDGLNIKNAMMFQRRIQGLVSYFKGADERLIPREINPDKRLVKCEMSEMQFMKYLEERWIEVQIDSKRGRSKTALNDDVGSYRTNTRLVSNFAIPQDLYNLTEVEGKVKKDKSDVLEKIKATPKRFLTPEAISQFSPKMAEMLKNIKKELGTGPFNNQFVFSVYKEIEGLGIFSALLAENGFQEYKIVKDGSVYKEADLKPGVPAFAFFQGGEDDTLRDYYRQIFNNKKEDNMPQTLWDSIKEPGRLCLLMATKAGAEGINLRNVRNVHILEPQWNPTITEQVIGRAIRICSHASLPMDQRTVEVKVYLSVFSQEQITGVEGPNIVMIRRNDIELKRHDVDTPTEVFMTTDEYLYEIAYRKSRIAKNLTFLLKQAAIDCEIHRKLHSRETPVIQCMRFDTNTGPDDLAFKPNYIADEKDTLYLRNIVRKKRRIQKIRVKGIDMILDPDTNEIFDAQAFEDNNRLLRIGTRTSATEIKWFI